MDQNPNAIEIFHEIFDIMLVTKNCYYSDFLCEIIPKRLERAESAKVVPTAKDPTSEALDEASGSSL